MSSVTESIQHPPSAIELEPGQLAQRISELGDWFHNLDLHGVPTAPHHFLGDFPNIKWRQIASAIPEDLTGATVLDVGCNGGFYSIEMKKRGAKRVLGIDVDDRYLNQARFAAETLGVEIELQKCSVYAVDKFAGQFDYVLFMGVFYPLRYPLMALDNLIKKVAGKNGFSNNVRGAGGGRGRGGDYPLLNTKNFLENKISPIYFIEKN